MVNVPIRLRVAARLSCPVCGAHTNLVVVLPDNPTEWHLVCPQEGQVWHQHLLEILAQCQQASEEKEKDHLLQVFQQKARAMCALHTAAIRHDVRYVSLARNPGLWGY